ncbi:MAG: hypothetical protein E6J88_14070 [Deltaproteobacteria bacterium]|nr:MAG: hypothetical protein E6J88_14070 [Deltaproteobacteria bacterium]
MCGRPSLSAAIAATSAVKSSTPITATGRRRATSLASSPAALSASRKRNATGVSSQMSASWWQTSLAGITSTPSFAAAETKSSLRYPLLGRTSTTAGMPEG